jgi:hypothetical protein
MMAIISVGNFGDFSLESHSDGAPAESVPQRIYSLANARRGTPAAKFNFVVSSTPRGLALQRLRLDPALRNAVQGLVDRFFSRTTYVYFLAWLWDMSGEPITLYPGRIASQDCLIPLGPKSEREVTFLGEGALLFPARPVHGGLALRIQIWESKKGDREFGATLAEASDAIKSSGLNTSLLAIATVTTGIAGATLSAVEAAALELAGVVGKILKRRGDTYLDFYEGYFSASKPWPAGPAIYKKPATEITLNMLA